MRDSKEALDDLTVSSRRALTILTSRERPGFKRAASQKSQSKMSDPPDAPRYGTKSLDFKSSNISAGRYASRF